MTPMRLVALALASSLSASAAAAVHLPNIFGDHMVLPRNADAPIWGRAAPGERVAIDADWMATSVEVTADRRGNWRTTLPTPDAGGPYAVTVRASNAVTLRDVLVGEVWLCSGQSNMEWPLEATEEGPAAIAGADAPRLRFFDVSNATAAAPIPVCAGSWQVCTPSTAASFSAVAYHFGRTLLTELDVPIGLIEADWGGTPAQAWMTEEAVRGHGGYDDALATLELLREGAGSAEAMAQERAARWWSAVTAADPGAREGWMEPDADDSAWSRAEVPGHFAGDLASFDGFVWLRRTVEIPAAWSGRALRLELGPIDDMDETYFQGVRVGVTSAPNRWNAPRAYVIPADLVDAGRAVIAVRVLDTGGPGGIWGEPEALRLALEGGADALPLAGTWRERRGAPVDSLPARPSGSALTSHTPSALYNGMIAPIVPFGIRGAIWYQGESNVARADEYRTLFPALIADWRRQFARGPFPFYFVQIAPFRYDDSDAPARLRDAQRLALAVPETGMAVTMDVGNPTDIHPRRKQPVGERLARWALAQTYGRDVVPSGPLYRGMLNEGNAIRLAFDHVGGGLVATGGGPLTHFTIAGPDRVFAPARARIEGETVVVEGVPNPVAVRYAWGAADEPNLANAEGLPASSFRTDDW